MGLGWAMRIRPRWMEMDTNASIVLAISFPRFILAHNKQLFAMRWPIMRRITYFQVRNVTSIYRQPLRLMIWAIRPPLAQAYALMFNILLAHISSSAEQWFKNVRGYSLFKFFVWCDDNFANKLGLNESNRFPTSQPFNTMRPHVNTSCSCYTYLVQTLEQQCCSHTSWCGVPHPAPRPSPVCFRFLLMEMNCRSTKKTCLRKSIFGVFGVA